MINIKDKALCTGCHACYSVCPKQCISMQSDAEGFLYPKVNQSSCVECGLCNRVCPIENKQQLSLSKEPRAFAAMNQNDVVRLQSSSGGIFTLIAEHVIDQGGVVFGVAMDDSQNPFHCMATTKEELSYFRGSKYVQSQVGDAYGLAEQSLKRGKTVLFTGTPCQIGGLYAFLQKPYDNLITQDIICHGVPSAMVWQKYIYYREKKAKAKVSKILFRNKKFGWKRHSLLFVFENQKEHLQTVEKDPYLRVFLSNLCLRPSCYDCRFKGKSRVSDLTLADYWGIENDIPQMDDGKGTSLVVAHSDKGLQMLNAIQKDIRIADVDLDSALRYNPCMVRSVSKPNDRDAFMKDVQCNSFDWVKKKYLHRSVRERMRRFVKCGKSFAKKCFKFKGKKG